jgi:hypothetical protein
MTKISPQTRKAAMLYPQYPYFMASQLPSDEMVQVCAHRQPPLIKGTAAAFRTIQRHSLWLLLVYYLGILPPADAEETPITLNG